MRENRKKQFEKGYVTLISILVIGAVGLSIATSLVLLGLGSSRTSFALEQGNQAKALANACAEEALQKVWDLDSYVGTGSLTLGQGSCTYSVSGAAAPKTITVSGMVDASVRKISITLDQLRPYLRPAPWQEVAN